MNRWSFVRNAEPESSLNPGRTSAVREIAPTYDIDTRVSTVVAGPGERVTDLKVYGIRTAGASHGSPEVLKTVIGWIYHNKITVDDALSHAEQERLTQLNGEAAEIESQLAQAKAERERVAADIEAAKRKAADTRKQLEGVRAGDSTLVEAHGLSDRLSFYISAGILTVLTVYLFLFYVSAIYNAFIFDAMKAAEEGLRTGRELSVTIFNGLAFQKAWATGLMTFIFLASAPSIVIGLGYLIHHFLQRGQKAAIFGIVLVTFAFDFLLAYEIVYQIHRIRVLTGETTQEWSARGVLFQSAEFYIILLAGFVVYIIWGLILQVVLDGIEKFNPARVASRKLVHELKELEKEIGEKEATARKAEREASALEGKLTVINEKRSPRTLRNNAFKRHLEEFMQGWFTYISQAFPDEQQRREGEARAVCESTLTLLSQ